MWRRGQVGLIILATRVLLSAGIQAVSGALIQPTYRVR